MAEAKKRCAVVTGSNRGIGFGICKLLASNGILVVLTAIEEKMGLEAIQKLKECSLSDHVVFHHLDVTDKASVASLAEFVRTQFGKLDILVNNAGVGGVVSNADAVTTWGFNTEGDQDKWKGIMTQTYELAEECVKINYYGTKRMVEEFVPLLQCSDSPRIVNISSIIGQLKNVRNEWAMGILNDAENLAEVRVDEVLDEFLKDFKEDSLKTKGWPLLLSAYIISKAAINAYTRILAKKHPTFCVNSVHPGYVKTDMTYNTGFLSIEEGAESPARLALLPDDGPSGCFFLQGEQSPF